jgi:hypothetical protein
MNHLNIYTELLPENLVHHLQNFKATKRLMQQDYSKLKQYLENGGNLNDYNIAFIKIDAERIFHNKSTYQDIYKYCMSQIDNALQFENIIPDLAQFYQKPKSLIENILQTLDELEKINRDTQELITVYQDAETLNALQLSLRRISPLNTDTHKHIFSFIRKTSKTKKNLNSGSARKGGNTKRRRKRKII